MENIEKIKKELINFVEKYNAYEYNAREKGLETIKGTNLTELFANICKYIHWYIYVVEKNKTKRL